MKRKDAITVRLERDLLCDHLLAPWLAQLAVQDFVSSRRTISINRQTGRVRMTQTYRNADGARAVLRLTLPGGA